VTADKRNFTSPAEAIRLHELSAVTRIGSGSEDLEPMKTIPLSQGKVALVDDEDFERISTYRWNLLRCRNIMYAQCHLTDRTVLMHRLVMNAPKGMNVDHRDQDGLNNQKSNLRVCTHTQNLQHMAKKITARSGFKGVHCNPAKYPINPWCARIQVIGKRLELGQYPSAELAASAYNNAAVKHFGQYASLNTL
jgi:hypothetical protein